MLIGILEFLTALVGAFLLGLLIGELAEIMGKKWKEK